MRHAGVACAAVALSCAGCGAGIREQSATSSTTATAAVPQDSAHFEIARLEGRIAFRRDELGLAPAEAPESDEKQKDRAATQAAPPQAGPAESPPPPPMPPMPIEASPSREPPRYRVAEEEPIAQPRPRATRCHDVAAAADEICDAAERICRLADQVADPPAHASCGRAREDCRHAKDLSGTCR